MHNSSTINPASQARVIALYLPQFHPIPENDLWWGKGFTEWTNVGKAKPLFSNHYQPRVPAELGYYDLRITEIREAQAQLAKEAGIEGFCYWHYWFGNGKRLLERPFTEVVSSGKPDFPFCLAWANETWKGFAHGLKNRNTLIEQQYPGDNDYTDHFYSLLEAFKDPRYIKVNGKPLFIVYKPSNLPNPQHFINLWQDLAKANGLEGIYFVAHHQSKFDYQCTTELESFNKLLSYGFDKVNFVRLTSYLEHRSVIGKALGRINKIFRGMPLVYSYKKFIPYFISSIDADIKSIPTIIPGWDHSPRSGREGLVMTNTTPDLFEEHVSQVIQIVKEKPLEERIVLIKSWNEWGEGNYLEPDLRWGKQFLNALKRQLIS